MAHMTLLPRAILFDLDDTLLRGHINADAAWLVVCEELAAELLPLPPAQVAEAAVRSARHFWSDAERHRQGRLQLAAARHKIVAGGLACPAAAGRGAPSRGGGC